MFDEIKGQHIVRVEQPNDTEIIFHTPARRYRYMAYAECCSESWIESIMGLEYLEGATIMQINEKSVAGLTGKRQEVDDADFVTFVTDKGYCDLEFRNSSNGWHGGHMELEKDDC